MDFEAALDEMLSLCFFAPGRIFKQAYYRKQTKNSWARDDPAFCGLQVAFLCIAAIAHASALHASLVSCASLVAFAVLVHWLGCGLVACSAGPQKGASMPLQVDFLAINGIRKRIHPARP